MYASKLLLVGHAADSLEFVPSFLQVRKDILWFLAELDGDWESFKRKEFDDKRV